MTPVPCPAADPVTQGARLFRIFACGREAERNRGDWELSQACAETRGDLRRRLLSEIPKLESDQLPNLSWMVYALGRVNDNDPAALTCLSQHADARIEPDPWVRYWALAGLLRSGRKPLGPMVKPWTSEEDDELVQHVLLAIDAREGSVEALEEIRASLRDRKTYRAWRAMRALRVCPLDDADIHGQICEVLESGVNEDLTYDAIKAAYHLDPAWKGAKGVALTLLDFVERWRTYQSRDAMRAMALVGLGKLKAPTAAPVLLEELLDANPTIVREAAISLESILGTAVAVRRVLEVAAEADRSLIRSYADGLRQMRQRELVVAELGRSLVSASPEQQECARLLLTELGGQEALQKLRARGEMMSAYSSFLKNTEERIQSLFNQSLDEARQGFRIAMRMDVAVFALGFLLILVSAILAALKDHSLTAVVASISGGSLGVLGVLHGLFVAKPRTQVTREVDHLMSLKVLFLAYLRQLYQGDAAFVRRIMEDELIEAQELDAFAERIERRMQNAVEALQGLKAP